MDVRVRRRECLLEKTFDFNSRFECTGTTYIIILARIGITRISRWRFNAGCHSVQTRDARGRSDFDKIPPALFMIITIVIIYYYRVYARCVSSSQDCYFVLFSPLLTSVSDRNNGHWNHACSVFHVHGTFLISQLKLID